MQLYKRKISILFILLFSISLIGCSGVKTTSVKTTQQNINKAVKYEGPKARIAVANFKCKAAKCGGNIGSGIRDMLVDALVKTNKFIVLERGEGFEEIKKELELGQSGYVQEEKAPQVGLMEGADIIVIGSIVAFEPSAGGIKGGIGGLLPNIPVVGGLKLGKKDAYIAMVIRLVDVRTGRIINSTRVEGKASSFNIGGLGGGLFGVVPLGGGLEVYKNTPMEKAIMVLIDNTVKTIEKYVPDEYYRYSEGKIIKNPKKTLSSNNSLQKKETKSTGVITKSKFKFIEGAWHGKYYGHVGSGEWSWVIWKNPDGTYGGRLNTSGTYAGRNIPIKIEVENSKIKAGWVFPAPVPMVAGISVQFTGTIEGNKMKGTWMFSNSMDSGNWYGIKGKSELTPKLK